MEIQEKQDYHCSLPDFKSVYKDPHQNYTRLHTREKPFLCDQCQGRFSSKSYLAGHVRRVHRGLKKVLEKKYKCSLCPYAAYTKCTLHHHIRTHLEERSFPCLHPGCQYAAKTSGALCRHKICKHENERAFVCQLENCAYRGNTPADMKQHALKHSEQRPFVCDFEGCNYRAKKKSGLRGHKLGVHHGGYKPFACSMCNHCSSSKTLLRQHQFYHAEEKTIKCHFSGCTYKCKSRTLLDGHVLDNHAKRTFKCDFAGCLSSAASRSKLEKHKKSVHYEKTHQCPHCEYRAAYSWTLQRHIKRHQVSQRVQCPKKGCNFWSKNREALKGHVKRHEANLDCPVEGCVYICTSRFSWNCHMQVHDPTGRPYRCPLCPKYFLKNYELSNHLTTHTQEKPFKCSACDFSSASKKTIMQHLRKKHSNLSIEFVGIEKYFCNHCYVNFGSAIGLAVHTIKLKTAVVVLTRLQLKYDN